MKAIFCGGAGEIGASCILLNIDGKNIVLDCGIRMGAAKDQLPDFRKIQESGGVDAIIISHAHMDHGGSLPILSREYPNAKIYMTHATKDIVRVLLYDSLKIMENREQEIPLFAEIHVKNMLGRIVCFSPGYSFKPFDEDISVTFHNAGHVAGSACVYIAGREGAIFYSGDFSLTRQRTVEGASIPRLRPDMAIFESTYGDRLHAGREAEEERLAARVKEIVSAGKKILIPAFALGRAQEVILVLKRAINRGELPQFRIYVDGMVNDICRIYRMNPNYLRNQLAKQIFRGNEIFFDDNIISVTGKQRQREEIISRSEGCCIISSSGMLTGGPSQWYAEKIAADEGNYIAITGYQDEESPGRQLLELADMPQGSERALKIGDRSIPVKCGIGKYGLSAHADKTEIISLVHSLGAKNIFFIHGGTAVASSLAAEVQKEYRGMVYAPVNNEEYEIDIKNPRKQLEKAELPTLDKNGMPSADDIRELWELLEKSALNDRGFTVEELLYCHTGSTNFQNADIYGFCKLLDESIYFEAEMRRPFIFHAADREKVSMAKQDAGMELNAMLSLADTFFPPETGLYKKGARLEEKTALLYFSFPQSAAAQYGDRIAEFEAMTGWKAELNSECNLSAAENLIYRLLPDGTGIMGGISYFRNDNIFKIRISTPMEDSVRSEIQERFLEMTGAKLAVELTGERSISLNMPVKREERQMEQNRALTIIQEAFDAKEDRLYRKSVKLSDGQPVIELAFISPAVGERYKSLIEELESRICWKITINRTPNQNEILNIARRLFEKSGLFLKKNPAYMPGEMEVKAVIQHGDAEIIRRIKEDFERITGLKIDVTAGT